MKFPYILVIAATLLLSAPRAFAQASPDAVQSTVCFQTPSATCNAGGTLVLTLSQDAMITNGGGQVAPTVVTITLDSTGKIPAGTVIWGNDQLTPSGTYYTAKLYDSSGSLIYGPETWVIGGTSPIDLAQMTPASPVISYPLPAMTGVANTWTAAQTFNAAANLEAGGALSGTFTGSPTLSGEGAAGNVALKAASSDAVQYVSPNGSDSNDGLSWGTAKQTLYAAVQAIATGGGTIYVAANTACGGPVSGQGLWLYRTGSSPGTGWLQVNALNIIGVGTGTWYNNAPAPVVSLNCGSATEPALQLENINSSLRFQNLGFSGSIGANLIGGVTTVTFDNVDFGVNDTVATNGPSVFIGQASFWLFFRHCVFQANDNAGKATDGSDATEALVANPSGGAAVSLVFVDESIERSGDLKWYGAASSNSLSVDGLTDENATDGKGAVWILSTSWSTITLKNVGVADASINPTPAVENDGTDSTAVLVSGATGNGLNTIGPMTYLSGYASNLQNYTEIPYVQGLEGFFGHRVWAQTDAGRRLFAPVSSRFVNHAFSLPSQWANDYNSPVVTSVTAPDGTDNAGEINGGSGGGGRDIGVYQPTASNGDYFIGGVWIRAPSGGVGTVLNFSTCTSIVPLTPTTINTSGYLGQGYIGGGGEWEWWSFAVKLSGLSGPTSCYTKLQANVGASELLDYYAPVLYYVPTGTITDSEAAYVALHLATYPPGLNPPVEATLLGHPFAFGGSGDNYFATLDHTTLTANQTFTFPNASGTVGLVLSGTTGSIGGSALTAGSCASGTVAITGATAGMPVIASASNGSSVGGDFGLSASVTAANTVTVEVCAYIAGTPTAQTYNVRVIQ